MRSEPDVPPTQSAEYAFQHCFDDFDEFTAAAIAWDLDFRPLRRPSASTRLTQIGGAEFQVGHAQLGCHCDQTGSTPTGFRTYAVPLSHSSPINWAQQAVGDDTLLVFGSDRELAAATLPGFDVYTVSLSEAALNACEAGHRLLDFTPASATLVNCGRLDMDRLRARIAALLGAALAPDRAADSPAIPPGLPAELAGLLWEAIAGASGQPSPRLAVRSRSRVLTRARDWLLANPESALSVTAMSRETGVPERTLRRAFVEHFGVPPKEYLRAMRLISVRRRLQQPETAERCIAEVAGAFGFWHASQFAADYRRLFGELPSKTLAQSPCTTKCA
ncbi:MAG: helix-turn-helix domain-containing protein [Pseudomonadota bacterium]|nr:helix-turn-helix domain-containing protein [Pseudomonadota bacterium]